jgi:hypothetical protein
MKTRIRSVVAALAGLCLFAVLHQSLFRNSSVSWFSKDFRDGHRNFYFKSGQWLADARTVVSAFHYLYESSLADTTNPTEVVSVPRLLPVRLVTTNGIVNDHPGGSAIKVGA